jgi:hypothetical protein
MMGVFRFLKTLVNPKAMAEEIIRLQGDAYRQAEKLYPGSDPHVLLAQVWLSRMAASGKVDPQDSSAHQRAFFETWQISVLPAPISTRTLGLYFVHQERPDVALGFSEYMDEFNANLAPVLMTMENGTFFSLYEERNPKMAYTASKETGTGWFFSF